MPVADVIEYERIWVEGLNIGDVSAADRAFTPDCTIHMTGVPQPARGIAAWKQLVPGLLTAFPDLHFTIEIDGVIFDRLENGKVRERWEQWDQAVMLQQLGVG